MGVNTFAIVDLVPTHSKEYVANVVLFSANLKQMPLDRRLVPNNLYDNLCIQRPNGAIESHTLDRRHIDGHVYSRPKYARDDLEVLGRWLTHVKTKPTLRQSLEKTFFWSSTVETRGPGHSSTRRQIYCVQSHYVSDGRRLPLEYVPIVRDIVLPC